MNEEIDHFFNSPHKKLAKILFSRLINNMKINHINNTTFGNLIESGQTNNIKFTKEYSDNKNLLKYIEQDLKTDKFLKVENFDNDGNRVSIQEFQYLPNKTIEHYKNKSQEYTRTITKEIKEALIYITEVFESKTSPANNYIHESIRDLEGKILKLFANGKQIL